MESVLCMNVSQVDGINVRRATRSLPLESGLLAVERPTHRRSDQQVRQSACGHSYAGNPLSSRKRAQMWIKSKHTVKE